MFGPAVVVHGLEHVRAALRPGQPVLLLSGRGAGWYAGAGWWLAMIAAARAQSAEWQAADWQAADWQAADWQAADWQAADLLDCASAPGAAMAALRAGQRGLILDPRCAAFGAVARAAITLGATLQQRRPPSLDLAAPGAERLLPEWLAQQQQTESMTAADP